MKLNDVINDLNEIEIEYEVYENQAIEIIQTTQSNDQTIDQCYVLHFGTTDKYKEELLVVVSFVWINDETCTDEKIITYEDFLRTIKS